MQLGIVTSGIAKLTQNHEDLKTENLNNHKAIHVIKTLLNLHQLEDLENEAQVQFEEQMNRNYNEEQTYKSNSSKKRKEQEEKEHELKRQRKLREAALEKEQN